MFDINPNYGKPYYPWWHLDKNISWHNVDLYITRFIVGFFTLKFLNWKKNKEWFVKGDLRFWLPPIDKEPILK